MKSIAAFTANSHAAGSPPQSSAPAAGSSADRVSERKVSAGQLELLADWLRGEPEVPAGRWFKKFPGMTVCGEGEWIKTFLQPGQLPDGEEIKCILLRRPHSRASVLIPEIHKLHGHGKFMGAHGGIKPVAVCGRG